jgi:hypothetical protein
MLRSNRVELGPFHVLVGQNATGKSTFLGAMQFVAHVLSDGVASAVANALGSRPANFAELCFDGTRPIAFAFDVSAPHGDGKTSNVRYEIEVGPHEGNGLRVLREQLFILPENDGSPPLPQPSLFGDFPTPPIVHDRTAKGWRKVVSKTAEGKDYFRDERTEWNNVFRFGPDRAALGSIPEDPERFPVSIAVRDLLRDGVRTVALDATTLRAACPPGTDTRIALDGSNLPSVVRELKARDPVLFEQWVKHVASGVVGLSDVAVHERPEDKYLVLRATFAGLHTEPVPSWLLSDGTLRMMALTLLTYSATDASRDVYLVEEPENGLHPLAMQAAYEALSSPIGGLQVLCATHSPVFLANVRLNDALVFRRAPDGSAIVRRGNEVKELEAWQGSKNLSELFATGVLA